MSEINDALKRARQTPPPNTPNPLPPRRPRIPQGPSIFFRLVIPLFVIILIFAAIFFIGWASAHHTIHSVIAAQDAITATQQVSDVVPVFQPIAPLPPPPPPMATPPELPKLQGIFYSPTAPTAILDGKTIEPGGKFGDYRVKEISKYTVTLTDTNGKDIKIGMSN